MKPSLFFHRDQDFHQYSLLRSSSQPSPEKGTSTDSSISSLPVLELPGAGPRTQLLVLGVRSSPSRPLPACQSQILVTLAAGMQASWPPSTSVRFPLRDGRHRGARGFVAACCPSARFPSFQGSKNSRLHPPEIV